MLQNSQTHLKNRAALYKILKVSDHPEKLYNKEYRDVIVRYQIKLIKIVCYIFYFNQIVFKPFLESGVEVIVFVSSSVWLFQRRGPVKILQTW